jgi:hypothetical protein
MENNDLGIVNDEPREVNEIDPAEVKKILSRIKGKCLSDVSLGIGSFLFLEFGEKIPYSVKTNRGIHRGERGEWRFWLYLCLWTIKHGEDIMLQSDDERELIAERINDLKSSKLENIELNDRGELNIMLSNEYRIITYVDDLDGLDEVEERVWILFMPDLRSIRSSSDCKFKCEEPAKKQMR